MNKIKLYNKLGHGQFGNIFEAKCEGLFPENVAVKQLKGDFLQFIFELYNEQCFTFRSTF